MNELPAIRNGNDDYPALMALAKELCTTGFLPVAIKTPAQAVAIILTGRELGLPPMQSLRSICIIQGKPELSADLQLSIFHRDGGRSKWLELTSTTAKLLLKHPNGDDHTEVFTMDDAKRAGLAAGQNWQKYPKAMLRSRAITAGLKSIGFEPLTGAYVPGEIGGPEIVEAEPETVEPEAGNASEQAATSPPPSTPTPPVTTPPAGSAGPTKGPTAHTRTIFLQRLGAHEEGLPRNTMHSYLVALRWLDNDKVVDQLALWYLPDSPAEFASFASCMANYSQTGFATIPYQPHRVDPNTLLTNPPPTVLPSPPALNKPGWRDFLITFGRGTKGRTLGSFEEHDLKLFIEGFEVVEQGYPQEIVAAQKALRVALDEAAKELAEKPKT